MRLKICRKSKTVSESKIASIIKSPTKISGAEKIKPSPGSKTLPPPLSQAINTKTNITKTQMVAKAKIKVKIVRKYFIVITILRENHKKLVFCINCLLNRIVQFFFNLRVKTDNFFD
jgi:hypothetical protein